MLTESDIQLDYPDLDTDDIKECTTFIDVVGRDGRKHRHSKYDLDKLRKKEQEKKALKGVIENLAAEADAIKSSAAADKEDGLEP